MSLRPDHKALIFLGSVAVLGAGVRVIRANRPREAQPALERQMRAADSAAHASKSPSRAKKGSRKRPSADSTRDRSAQSPLDRVGYIGDKLDLDVATAAQIDSLPGVSPAMAKRIVADRIRHGPFLNLDGLRRVSGAGPGFLRAIDAHVAFSGTIRSATPADSVIPKRVKR